MGGFRLTPLIVSIVGSVLCIGAAVALWFLLIQPTTTDLATQQARYDAVRQYNENPQLVVQAKKKLADAQAQVVVLTDQWNGLLRTKNPHVDVSDRFRGWIQWTNELEYDFAPRVEAFLKHTGVTPLTKISAPAPPSDPNAVPTTMIAMPLGTIQVFGSYDQILRHVAAWNRFDRFVVIDKDSLEGYSPFMTGSYTATEYIFTLNGDKPGPPVPSGSSGTAGAPGAASAPGMGAPGGPPGGRPGA